MRTAVTIMSVMAAAGAMSLMKAAPGHAEGAAMEVSPSTSRPANPGPAEMFTGDVSVQSLFEPNGNRHAYASQVTFTPCARTAWHTHPGGQTLVVVSGSGWVQEWGGAKQRIAPGDVVWTPPGVKHWHGATDATEMSHIATQEAVDGEQVVWLEHVTDEQYFS